jgi:hypothetical protein
MIGSGARFGFCAEARVVDMIPPERHTFRWLAKRAFRGGFVFTRLECSRRPVMTHLVRLPKALAASVVLATLLPLALLGGRVAAARLALRLCTQVGHLYSLMNGHFEEYADQTGS